MAGRIGDYLIERGLLKQEQIEAILNHQKQTGMRFGESARALGFMTDEDVRLCFLEDDGTDFFYLDPRFFPKFTRHWMDPWVCLRRGVLPLGIKSERGFFRKKTYLNLGCLQPLALPKLKEDILQVLPKQVDGLRPYLIAVDQFLSVLELVYGLKEEDWRAKIPETELPTPIRVYLHWKNS